MEAKWTGYIEGLFEGYSPGRVYALSDGSLWRQEGGVSEYVYRERARARLIWNQSIDSMFLDVDGTSGIVQVVEDRGMKGMGPGAF